MSNLVRCETGWIAGNHVHRKRVHLAALPTVMTIINVVVLDVPGPPSVFTRVAILIPARDEAAGIAACVESALASTVGWSGKVHACHVLAQLTDAPNLIFLDADVLLAPGAAAQLAGGLAIRDLVSGVPRQRMESLAELLIIPMINMLLLGYLPIFLARRDPRPALAAACGQMIAVRADAYAAAGGHAAIRASLHDGLALPRRFREAGFRTDLVAGAGLASCRMYAGWRTTVFGTLKNATEGLARPIALPVWTLLLLGGHVLPWVVLPFAFATPSPIAATMIVGACGGPLIARLIQAVRCREPLRSVPLNPFAVAALLALQWLALSRKWTGRAESWRGRSYPRKV